MNYRQFISGVHEEAIAYEDPASHVRRYCRGSRMLAPMTFAEFLNQPIVKEKVKNITDHLPVILALGIPPNGVIAMAVTAGPIG